MRIPETLTTLYDYGVLEDVVRPLMSGKEAQVYLVVSGGKYAVAKIYKEAQNRTFKHRAEYTEGRKVRNTRDQRAIDKRSKHGRQQDEAAWRSTEVDMIHRLHAGGVRVPVPYHYIDGVLIMELITDAEGNPAPRLGDVGLDRDTAIAVYDKLIREVARMLCAGVVHGDLSEFNVLLGNDGPVIIDFPQSVDSARNTNARRLLLRDVDNLHRFLHRAAPGARTAPYAQEMWNLYEQNLLTPETRLRGDYRPSERRVDTAAVLDLIGDANRDERKRRDNLGLRGGPRPGAPPQQPAKKKEPAVYQGLPNQGLSSFRGQRALRNDRSSSHGQHGGQGQRNDVRPAQPPRNDLRPAQPPRNDAHRGPPPPRDAQRPQAVRNDAPRHPSARNDPQHRQGAAPQGRDARAERGPARPEVERIHVRPRDPQVHNVRPPPPPAHQGNRGPDPQRQRNEAQHPHRSASRPQHEAGRHERPHEPPRNVAPPAPPADDGNAPRRRRVIRSGNTPDRTGPRRPNEG